MYRIHGSPHEYPAPGTPVYVDLGLFKHLGIVSDRWAAGKPLVISNSARAGGTREEPWTVFSQGDQVRRAALWTRLSGTEVVARARHWLGQAYRLGRNCDHHVRYALDLPQWSPQFWALLGKAALVLVAIRGLGGGRAA